jgi:hypothetical protein
MAVAALWPFEHWDCSYRWIFHTLIKRRKISRAAATVKPIIIILLN